jgi:hypothetical protein
VTATLTLTLTLTLTRIHGRWHLTDVGNVYPYY